MTFGLDQLREAKAHLRERIERLPGIMGYGLGDNKLVVYIGTKADRAKVPTEIDGVPVEVIVSGPIKAL